MTKKKPAAKKAAVKFKKNSNPPKEATVEQMKFTWTPYNFEAVSNDERLREKCLDIALKYMDHNFITASDVKITLDRAEQFYQFVKKK